MRNLLRLLLISALAWVLVGCSSPSQQAHRGFEYAGRGLYRAHHEQSSQVHQKRRVSHGRTRKHKYPNKIAKSDVVPTKSEVPPPSQHDDEAKKTLIPPTPQLDDQAKKTEIPPTPQLDDEFVIKKAKATIAAKMSDPDSVKFENVELAARKNAIGNSIETICGFVRDKNGGPKPFLYLVQTNEAYIGGYTIATSEYRNICSGR